MKQIASAEKNTVTGAGTANPSAPSKLVSAPRLLEELFDEDSRPSLRTLRNWTAAKTIPFVRLGHLIFFYPCDVRAALDKKHTVRAKGDK